MYALRNPAGYENMEGQYVYMNESKYSHCKLIDKEPKQKKLLQQTLAWIKQHLQIPTNLATKTPETPKNSETQDDTKG